MDLEVKSAAVDKMGLDTAGVVTTRVAIAGIS